MDYDFSIVPIEFPVAVFSIEEKEGVFPYRYTPSISDVVEGLDGDCVVSLSSQVLHPLYIPHHPSIRRHLDITWSGSYNITFNKQAVSEGTVRSALFELFKIDYKAMQIKFAQVRKGTPHEKEMLVTYSDEHFIEIAKGFDLSKHFRNKS